MAKKKRSERSARPSGPREVEAKDARLGPIATFEDVADSEDEFMVNRDKVLLDDGPDERRKRKWREEGKTTHERITSLLILSFAK